MSGQISFEKHSVGKTSLQQMLLRQLNIHMQKNELGPLPNTVYKH